MNKLINLFGQKFGRLTVIARVENNKEGRAQWLCKCDCNNENEMVVIGKNLRTGNTQSCGCLQRERATQSATKHGLYYHSLYCIWYGIIQRCNYVKSTNYENYGSRGISICDKWRYDFKAFYDWAISNGWEKGLYIDRIDNDGNYEPSNCRWVTARASASHKRTSSPYGPSIRKTKGGKYIARCYYKGRHRYLGTFNTQEEAQQARKNFLDAMEYFERVA